MIPANKIENQWTKGNILRLAAAENAIGLLHATRGVEKAFLLDEHDIIQIRQLEVQDGLTGSSYFGKKRNIGVKQALRADILLAFITNKDYEWPRDNLKIMHGGEIIGRDISDPDEMDMYQNSSEHCVFGNIVVNCQKIRELRKKPKAPVLVISGKPWKGIESMDFVSEAVIASPSRLTDEYLKSKILSKSKLHIGTFLLGLDLE
ncbi:hypothetical protein HWN40_11735 [Methanolobus zinderi]|uniref:Uncharacterized protein n=1 Tax=Methanolobus zinderi TaxID=536044 RepID=A0A7D5E7I9_9EURY|nr:hypothetical protein [Methanolobus zinderi]KXS44753.1 MAG: hypothetical protein AWU59_298 [Methanolobus sp. T82-4]QLC50852.1 hypothetical protein HWN40_11735 [Methanolobus zinderi]